MIDAFKRDEIGLLARYLGMVAKAPRLNSGAD
jgi:hypothetical protein